MSAPRMWQGTDGSTTMLCLFSTGRASIWTNMGWIDLTFEENEDPTAVCESYATNNDLVESSEETARHFCNEELPMTNDELAG